MLTIHKFPLDGNAEVNVLMMPGDADILCVDVQRGVPCVWARLDTRAPKREWRVRVYGTGHELPADVPLHYIGTFLWVGGAEVYHVFNEVVL